MSRERQFVYWLAGLLLFLAAVFVLRGILLPFVLGMAVAYFLDPAADYFERLGLSRTLSATILTVLFLICGVAVLMLLVPLLHSQIMALAARAPEYAELLRERAEDLLAMVQARLSPEDMERLLDGAEATARATTGPGRGLALRNSALLELLYSCGLRAAECAGLDWDHIDGQLGIVRVEHGKGGKQRVVPVGEPALVSLGKYRNGWEGPRHSSQAVFLNARGRRLSVRSVGRILEACLRQAGLPPGASPHALRHSFATHLLEGGAVFDLSPGGAHAEAGGAGALGSAGLFQNGVDIQDGFSLDRGIEVGALGAVPAVFRAAACLDGQEGAELDCIGLLALAVYALSAVNQLHEGKVVDDLHFLKRPVVSGGHGRGRSHGPGSNLIRDGSGSAIQREGLR